MPVLVTDSPHGSEAAWKAVSDDGNLADARDDDDDESSQHQCSDCATWSPRTRTEHTLISSRHGWRLLRAPNETGGFEFTWRCPRCWAAFKSRP